MVVEVLVETGHLMLSNNTKFSCVVSENPVPVIVITSPCWADIGVTMVIMGVADGA